MHRLFFASFASTTALLVAAILGLSLWVDPFGHFRPTDGDGLDRQPAYFLNRALFKVVELKRVMADAAKHGEKVNIVVGDSTSNQIDPDIVARAVGGRWLNMSYGKATLQENVDLLNRIIGSYPVGEVVWNVPFERVQNYIVTTKNEMPRAWKMADEPWLHLFTFESLRASWYVLRKHWFDIDFGDPDLGLRGAERIAYDLYSARVELNGIPWPDEFVAQRDAVEELARQNGVPLSYSRMPVHPEMQNLYVTLYADHYGRYRDLFTGRCLFDLDAARPGGWIPEQFRDAVHLEAAYRSELSQRFAAACEHPCTARVAVDQGLAATGPATANIAIR